MSEEVTFECIVTMSQLAQVWQCDERTVDEMLKHQCDGFTADDFSLFVPTLMRIKEVIAEGAEAMKLKTLQDALEKRARDRADEKAEEIHNKVEEILDGNVYLIKINGKPLHRNALLTGIREALQEHFFKEFLEEEVTQLISSKANNHEMKLMTRDEARTAGEKRYSGMVCPKHPELNGERWVRNGDCVGCGRERKQTSKYRNAKAMIAR